MRPVCAMATSLCALLWGQMALTALEDQENQTAQPPLDIGSRLELLLDDYLIASMTNVTFRMHPPRPAEQVLSFDQRWEGPTVDYITVFKDGDRYRMYYACHPFGFSGERQYTGYAESTDAVNWTRPSLGIVDFEGSTDNNLVWSGSVSHNLSPFVDTRPGTPSDERYKAIAGHMALHVLASADAIHWRLLKEEPIVAPDNPAFDRHNVPYWGDDPAQGRAAFDSQNVGFWDAEQGQYVCSFRARAPVGGADGPDVRTVFRTASPDFLNWSEPEPLEYDVPLSGNDQLYTNGIQPYFRAPHIYIGLPMRYVGRAAASPAAPSGGLGEGLLMFSRDGRYFHRRMEAFLRPGTDRLNWSKHSNMFAWGIVPTAEDEISVYYTQHYWADTAHLQRGVLRTDGFISLNAPYAGGELVTKPIVFSGDELVLNASTGAAGGILVEVQDAAGTPLEHYRLEDCSEFYGDEIAHVVRWNEGSDVTSLAGTPVRLRFVMRDADLYSIQFRGKGQ